MKKEYVNPIFEVISLQSEETLSLDLSGKPFDNDVPLFGDED